MTTTQEKIIRNKNKRIKELNTKINKIQTYMLIAIAIAVVCFILFVANMISYKMQVDELSTTYTSQIQEVKSQNEFLERTPAISYDQIKRLNQFTYVMENDISPELIMYADEQCQKNDVNPQLLWCIVEVESQYDSSATNLQGSSARGLGQIVIKTAKYLYEDVLGNGEGTYSHDMAYDPYINIKLMTTLLGIGLKNGNTLQQCIDKYSGSVSGYLDKVQKVANSHGMTFDNTNCRYQ